ncbi:MAG: alpha/beta hydrolase [Gammaproteobacteria bacterium]|nr:alpha/beta hydrolase [Gammaproteobacteria bacterium]
MKSLFFSHLIRCILLLSVCLPAAPALAREVQLTMPNKQTAIAHYWPNDKNKTAVLVLHGFLQTSEFSTIQFITDELVNNDYPVLAPTLSLNVNLRRQSLACDSVHTHNINDNNQEIKRWIQLLEQQGYQSIILIGHSSGNLQLISYLHDYPDPAIKALIAVSPGTTWNPYKLEQTQHDILLATEAAKKSSSTLNKYSLGFCENNYTATAENYLSYANWSDTYLLNAIKQLNISTDVIIGNKDPYLPARWIERLRQQNINITVIDGANHFFSGDAEFLLQDSIITILNKDR